MACALTNQSTLPKNQLVSHIDKKKKKKTALAYGEDPLYEGAY